MYNQSCSNYTINHTYKVLTIEGGTPTLLGVRLHPLVVEMTLSLTPHMSPFSGVKQSFYVVNQEK